MLFGKMYLKPGTVLRAEIQTGVLSAPKSKAGKPYTWVNVTVFNYTENSKTTNVLLECESMEQALEYMERIQKENTPDCYE